MLHCRLHGRGAGDNVWRRPAAVGVYGLLQGATAGTKLLGDGVSKGLGVKTDLTGSHAGGLAKHAGPRGHMDQG